MLAMERVYPNLSFPIQASTESSSITVIQSNNLQAQSQNNTIQSSISYSLSLYPLATLHHPRSLPNAAPLYAAGHAAALPIARFLPAIIVIAFPFCTATATAPLNSCDTTSCCRNSHTKQQSASTKPKQYNPIQHLLFLRPV